MREPRSLRPAGTPWPAPPDQAAYHGLAGEIVRVLDPHTEADPVGVLVTLLAGFGNALGVRPHLVLDGKRHPLSVWPLLIGATGTGRKGTALAQAARVFERALPVWWGGREGSLATGEGLIQRVRDATKSTEVVRRRGKPAESADVVTDLGVADKRLFVAATEFGGLLRVMGREGNILSPTLRNAWDGEPLGTVTRSHYLRATGAHIGVTGHITPEELRDLIGPAEAANGFANRFLWVLVRRSKLLPLGGDPDEGALSFLGDLFAAAIEDASRFGRMRMNDAAVAVWTRVYPALASETGDIVGHLLSRAEPMVQRLAALYAALDATATIGVPHLEAALALWGYADASVRHLFGQAPAGGAQRAYRRTILDALAGGSLTQTEISEDLFARNLPAAELHATLDALLGDGLVERAFTRREDGRGRTITRWSLAPGREEGGPGR